LTDDRILGWRFRPSRPGCRPPFLVRFGRRMRRGE
jgi:hypothetical protein